MPALRIGIVGCGRIARMHCEGYRRHGAVVTGVTDVDPERAEVLASAVGARAYADPVALATSGQVDAIDICSPPAAHAENVAAVAPFVRDIFLEKPMAADLDGCRRIIDVARLYDLRVMTGFFHRFHEPLLILKQMLSGGELGRIVTLRNRFMIAPDSDSSRPWLWDRSIAGGGVVVHTSSHSLDLFRFLVGEVTAVSAVVAQTDPSLPLEDTAVITVRSASGAMGILEAYGNAPFTEYGVDVQGTAGEARVGYFPPRLSIRMASDEHWRSEPLTQTEPHHRIYEGLGAFVRGVQAGTAPSPGLAEGLRAMELVADAYSAAERENSVRGPQ